MKQKITMIWKIICGKQIVVITEDNGNLYYNWRAKSITDVCKMCKVVFNIAYKKEIKK